MYPSIYLYLSINFWVVFLDVMEKEAAIIISNFLTVQIRYIKPVDIVSKRDNRRGGHYWVFMRNVLTDWVKL